MFKMRNIKVYIFVILGILLIAGIGIYEFLKPSDNSEKTSNNDIIIVDELSKTCDDCDKTLNDYRNYTLVYSSDNGSLPPPYHRERTLTASKNTEGKVTAEYEINDYSTTLEKKEVYISSEQFDSLVNDALLVAPGESDSLEGCTGGTSKSLQVFEGEKSIIDVYSYNCAGKTTNKSLEDFYTESEIGKYILGESEG